MKKIFLVALCIILIVCVLVSCDNGKDNGASADNETGQHETSSAPVTLATGVTLNKNTLSLIKGGSEILTATVTPTDATYKSVTWITSDVNVATVNNGTVTAVGAGTATITVATANGKTATCEVTVSVLATDVTLNKNNLSLIKGESEALSATVAPTDTTDKSVVWTTSDSSVATVNGGTVTAVGAGTATITATTANGKTATCEVTVSVLSTGVTLNKSTLSLIKGGSEALIATVAPTDATDKSVIWTTSDANVATVNGGTVTAVGAGTATVTATTANGNTATCEVTVNVIAAGVTLSKTEATVNLGDSLTLSATFDPPDTTDQAITWESSNTAVATVVNGVVSTLKAGSTTITATTSNGKTVSCVVTVRDNAVIQYALTADSSFYVVTGITGRANELEIPFLHDGLRVVAIQAGAFEGNTDIQKVILPNSIEYIYDNAFKECVNLQTINLPNSLIHIGESAFEECSSLRSVTIPYLVETVSAKAFYHCTSLESVTVISEPEPIERLIGSNAFYQCTSLKNVAIGTSVETIGENAFAYCTSMMSFTAGEGLRTISNNAFDNCTALIRFEMPDTVTTIGHMAFRHAEALKAINFSQKLTAIGNACFQYCVSLDNVELHGGIVSIGESCFSFCSGMKNLRILGDITTLGDSSFYECTGLTNVYFASSISKDLGINNYVFYNAGTLGGGITLTLSPDACIPDRLFEPQEDQNRPKLVKLIVEDGATKVNYFIKYNNLPYLASIELTDSITDIKNGTFDNTAWYKAQPDGALYIGNVFYGYKGTLDGELTISDDTVCIAFGALKDQKPTKLTVPFVGAVLNGSQNTHFGYIFGAESVAVQGECIPVELTSVKVTKCQYEISDTAFIGCEFTVDIEHHWIDWNITTPETCLAVGEEARNCSVCENTEKRERAIADHTYANIHKTENGHWYSCAVNGCSAETAVQEHQWGEWQVTVEPDCISTGSRYHVCSVCEHTVTETLAIVPDAHSWNNENTCTYCSVYKDSGVVFTFNESTSTYSITDYTGSADSVIIPSTYKGYAVTSIGEYAFKDCSSLTIITIPSSVTSIGDYAFYGCTGLASVTIPNSVESIGDYAFYGCTGLASVTIPNSVTSIGSSAFSGCSGLTSITLPFVGASDTATTSSSSTLFGYVFGTSSYTGGTATKQNYSYIYDATYYIPTSLKSVTITGGNILYGAFYNCSSLTSITIPDSVKSIGSCAFEYCKELTSVTIGNGVESIGTWAFYGCTGLTSITIPDSVESIGSYAFSGCTGLEGVYITDIAAWCGISFGSDDANPLYYAGNLYLNGELVTDLVIPDGVTSISEYAFYNCSGLTSITIPDTVTSIGSSAFNGCTGLTGVYITDIAAWCGISFDNYSTNPLYYAGNLYLNGELVTDLVIPDGVTSIGEYAFYNCKKLTSVTIPDSVKSIGSYAFYGCTSLTSITIPNSVTSIGSSSFSGCSNLKYTEHNNGKYLGNSENPYVVLVDVIDTAATSFTIPNTTKFIYSYAFSGCTGLASVTIPDSVMSIGEYSFNGCTELTNITVEGENKKYHSAGNCVIETESKTLILGCKNSVIPTDESVTSIGDNAFDSCWGLANVTIPDSVTTIGSSAFSSCTGLTSITIPDNVTSIGDEAFEHCSGLVSVTIGNGVESIGDHAFSNCSDLTSITFNGTKSEWSAINKDWLWDYNISATKVVCTDGEVAI